MTSHGLVMNTWSRQMSIGRAGRPANSGCGWPIAPAANRAAATRALFIGSAKPDCRLTTGILGPPAGRGHQSPARTGLDQEGRADRAVSDCLAHALCATKAAADEIDGVVDRVDLGAGHRRDQSSARRPEAESLRDRSAQLDRCGRTAALQACRRGRPLAGTPRRQLRRPREQPRGAGTARADRRSRRPRSRPGRPPRRDRRARRGRGRRRSWHAPRATRASAARRGSGRRADVRATGPGGASACDGGCDGVARQQQRDAAVGVRRRQRCRA